MTAARFALYAAPSAESPLEHFAAAWLGRSSRSGEPVAQRGMPGLDGERMAGITASPRRYGFHATLKAPFALAEAMSADGLHEAAQSFARRRAAFDLPLRVASLDRFLALVPTEPSPAVHELADECVRLFDRFRAPADAVELAKRRAAGLNPRQEACLTRWGYPYVFDEFRYHMTLTERLADPLHDEVLGHLRQVTEALLAEPFRVDALAVFEEPERGAPFVMTARYPFLS
ncbi:DUF1045 domain-containing protein [Marinivivus vitaminiproducens]|uniref:DUF1045 domain-containing protein n=1 Tax=Marinivivus vitaminiproducens TaxID=3035935 RepID=UPI0027A5B551|nr:DUF1045 domain-containing protein [Geminicoccaceae bacterium SCSIO 64248]